AIDAFRKAGEKAAQRVNAGGQPDSRVVKRRGEILSEMAAAMIQAKQYRDAMNTYATIINDKLLPAREDEMLLEQATAAQLAGDYAESEKVCVRFIEKHKASTLLPAVLFRQAENSAFLALAAEKLPNPPDRAREMAKHNDEAIKRYNALID